MILNWEKEEMNILVLLFVQSKNLVNIYNFLISKSLLSIPDVNSGDLKLVSPSNNNLSNLVGIIFIFRSH